MSAFHDALRVMRQDALVCPRCDASNADLKPGAKPTVELNGRDEAACNRCGHCWKVKD